MPDVLLKKMPDHLHARLKASAATHRRSLSAEAITLLERILNDAPRRLTLEEIDALRVRGTRPITDRDIERGKREGRP